MDKPTRDAIAAATAAARVLLERDYGDQLAGDLAILDDGSIAPEAPPNLRPRQVFARDRVVAALEHKRGAGLTPAQAVADYVRDAAFTTVNRFVALFLLEARGLVQQCVSRGEQSSGYGEYVGMAPALKLLPDGAGYRLYLESIFDELSTEVKVLFDRRDPASALWPRRATVEELVAIWTQPGLAAVWEHDETIGWVYQYFNTLDERMAMKDTKAGGAAAPRNSRELATRNQFFTPRYVVQFLTDNTLGRLWWEMRAGDTALHDRAGHLAVGPDAAPPPRARKDPRDLRILDPACGSGHFLLYVFDLLETIYEEAWHDPAAPASSITGRTLREDVPTREGLRRLVPKLIVEHNLWGVDIDARCAQVATFALWLRAQRAWNDAGLARGDRPSIEASHVVLAEPLGADPGLAAQFASQLDPTLGRLFLALVDRFVLAGDLGVLLRAEAALGEVVAEGERATRQGTIGGGALSPAAFWRNAEAQLTASLTTFAERHATSGRERRRMFRSDTAHALALLEVVQTRFDVALMNPPFGDPSTPSKAYIDEHYDDSRQDLFAVFVERCVKDLVPDGFVGVLSTEAGFFRRTLEPWRRMLLRDSSLIAAAHLGGHVLDSATVRVAAYATCTTARRDDAVYMRLLQEPRDDREALLSECVDAVRRGQPHRLLFACAQAEFEKLPYAVFGYWCSSQLRDVFVRFPALEGHAGLARQGLATADDFRFLRLRWEVPPTAVHREAWMPFAKGGEYSPYVDDVHLTLRWHENGRELAAWPKSYARNTHLFGTSGVTWPRRTNKRFAPRVFPAGCAFGDKGPVVVQTAPSSWALLAYLNSRPAGYFMSFGTGAAEVEGGTSSNSYEVGLVQRLPVPAELPADPALTALARDAWACRAAEQQQDETAAAFVGPLAPDGAGATLAAAWDARIAGQTARRDRYVDLQRQIDARVIALFGLGPADVAEIEANVGDVHVPVLYDEPRGRRAFAAAIASVLVGCAFGRWTPDRLTRSAAIDPDHAFAAPVAHRDEVADGPAILVDDEHHPLDLPARCTAALAAAFGARASDLARELATLLGVSDLREFLRGGFFDHHWSQYSKSKRSAALYLPIGTPSGGYTVWLYLHRLSANTLYDVDELVRRKIVTIEGRLASAATDGDTDLSASRVAAADRALLDELRELHAEVVRVKPLWDPALEDGALICLAPLWRLFPRLPAWQKELRETWDALCARSYDWSQQAMRLWPAAVIEGCATDRSLAVAHGLEEVLWERGPKDKWRPRVITTATKQSLVAERLAPAAIEARDSLIAVSTRAPATSTKKTRKKAAPKLARRAQPLRPRATTARARPARPARPTRQRPRAPRGRSQG